ncbi:MAG TPA: tetratricopeptide repeat protein [Tepidisphaeraceae bacterium]|nr:tetratricopeptide repeat protein [Tepidisphaeraceae bacterium]
MSSAVRSTTLAPTANARRANRTIVLALLALVFAVFGRSIFFDFSGFDDFLHVVDNPYFHPINAQHLGQLWTHLYHAYMPVTFTVWAALAKTGELPTGDVQGVRFNPYLFHAANVVLHAINVLLVWRILRRFVKSPWPAAAGAAVFAVHPLQVESVAWISSMKDVLGGMLALASVLVYLHFVDRPRAWWQYALATLLFTLAVLSKGTTIVTPALVVILLLLERGPREWRAWFLPLAPWFAAAPPYLWITSRQQGDAPLLVWSPLWFRPIEAADALAFYFRKLIWPVDLAIDYGRTPRWVMDHGTAALACLVVVVVFATATWQWRRRPALLAGLALFVVALAPVLGLVPFIFQVYSTVADRYLYLPMVGVALVVADAMERGGRTARVVVITMIAILSVLCVRQVGIWRDSASLFTHAIAVNPSNVIGWHGLGTVAEENRDLPAAVNDYRQAVQNRPDELQSLSSLAHALVRLKGPNDPETKRAYAAFLREGARRVLLRYPNSPLAHRKLAEALQMEGRTDEATAEFQRAIAVDPKDARSRVEFGQFLEATGHAPQAIEQYQIALQLHPADAATVQRLARLRLAEPATLP